MSSRKIQLYLVLALATSISINIGILFINTGSPGRPDKNRKQPDSVKVINTNTKVETTYKVGGHDYTQKQLADSAVQWLGDRDYYKQIANIYKKAFEKEIDEYNNVTSKKLDSLDAYKDYLKYLNHNGIDNKLKIGDKSNIYQLGDNASKMTTLFELYKKGQLNVEWKDSAVFVYPFKK